MGLDTEIRKWLKDSYAQPAWKQGAPVLDPERPWVLIEDIMTWMHTAAGGEHSAFTLDELMQKITQRYLEPLNGSFHVAVICADDTTRVPLEKAKEQAKRTKAYKERGAKRPKKARKWTHGSSVEAISALWNLTEIETEQLATLNATGKTKRVQRAMDDLFKIETSLKRFERMQKTVRRLTHAQVAEGKLAQTDANRIVANEADIPPSLRVQHEAIWKEAGAVDNKWTRIIEETEGAALRRRAFEALDRREAEKEAAEAAAEDEAEAEETEEKAKKAERPLYPDNATLCPEGIAYTLPGEEKERVEPIDLVRLLHSRRVRAQIWERLEAYLRERHSEIPAGRMLILDHFATGPVAFSAGNVERRGDLRHNLGEGELMCIFWLHVFERNPCVVDTTDTDIIPLFYHALCRVPRREETVIWRYWYSCHVDVLQMVDLIRDKMRFSPEEFMLACILCGTDYLEKQDIFAQVNLYTIFHGVQACANHVPHLAENRKHLEWIMRFIYNQYMTSRVKASNVINTSGDLAPGVPPPDWDELRETCVKKKYKSFCVASDKTLADTYATVLRHVNYWSLDVASFPRAQRLAVPLLAV